MGSEYLPAVYGYLLTGCGVSQRDSLALIAGGLWPGMNICWHILSRLVKCLENAESLSIKPDQLL